MMKKIYILFALTIYITNSYSQNYEITYNIDEYNLRFPDESKTATSLHTIKSAFSKASQYVKDVDFVLKSNNQTAVFNHENSLNSPNDSFNFTQIIIDDCNLNGTVFSDFTSNIQLVDKEVMGQRFVVKKTINSQKWILTKEQAKVLNKTCFIANRKDSITNSKGLFVRNVKAYYTKDISINAGPGNFCGLPGLVLKVIVTAENVNYSITAASINKRPPFKVKQPKGKTITEEELNKLIAKRKFF